MRRKDREVLEEVKIDEFIRNCDCCRIGFYDKENDEVYIVPLNFGYSNIDNELLMKCCWLLTLYIQSIKNNKD